MSKGKVAQTAVLRDIYREPANRFVAEIVGRNNIVAGKETGIDSHKVTIDLSIGQFVVISNEEKATLNTDITLVIPALSD